MNIRRYIESLRSAGDLLEIDAEINGQLELSAITDLMCKKNGPGLLFNMVKGTGLSLATNLFGSDRRMANALGYETLDSFGRWLSAEFLGAKGVSSAQRLYGLLREVETEPQPSTRVNIEVNLDMLPELRFWPREERSFLTLAVVISREPDTDVQNYGLYRVGIAGNRSLTLNLLPGSGAGRHLMKWRSIGKAMPVAILLGADPSLIFAAAAPLPPDCSEDLFSAYLSQTNYKSCRCKTVPLSCPTSGQIVIEGWINTEATLNEGPFGCYTGDYGGSNACPLVEVSALSVVDDPLIPLTLAGPLPMEDCWIARASLEIIRARLAIDIPEISSIAMPLETAFHGIYFVTSNDCLASVEELSRRMRSLDYLARIKMLILMHDTDDHVSETTWREILKKTPTGQIWRDPAADLEALLGNQPPKLQLDARMLENLLQRLRIVATDFLPKKVKDANRSDNSDRTCN